MFNKPPLTIGVIADTHLPYRLTHIPIPILEIFKDVDLIIHAGDVDQIDHLNPLAKLAPVYAVRGNFHFLDLSDGGKNLPRFIRLMLANQLVVVTHGHRAGIWELLFKIPDFLRWRLFRTGGQVLNLKVAKRLHKQYPEADIVIFGHTHAPFCHQIGQTLFFNPGPVVPTLTNWQSVGLIKIYADKVETEIIELNQYLLGKQFPKYYALN